MQGNVLVFRTRTKQVCHVFYPLFILLLIYSISDDRPPRDPRLRRNQTAQNQSLWSVCPSSSIPYLLNSLTFLPHSLSSYLLTNSQDRVIRHFEIPTYPPPTELEDSSAYLELEIEPTFKFADRVDKVQWNGIGYSADSEWVIGGE